MQGAIFITICSYFVLVEGLKTNPSIVIIGAGPSGIAAATKLWNNGFTNLTILEAENRIGGRINSIKFADAYVDLGGEWCHGEKDNIVYNMVKDFDILGHTTTSVQAYYSNGSLLDQEIYNNLVEFAESINPTFNNNSAVDQCGGLLSVGECFDKLFNSTMGKIYEDNLDKYTISTEAENWVRTYILSYDSSFTLYDLPRISSYRQCEGDLALHWNGRGYKTIIELMLQQYPDPSQELKVVNNIHLNKEVSTITWNDTLNQISVLCSDNSSYVVNHVIFTPSLGVLKAEHEGLFNPRLPDDKLRAITNIGFGAIMKIILKFSHTWWNTSEPYSFFWSSEDKDNILTEFGRGPVIDGRSWLTSNLVFLTANQNPTVLIGFFAGKFVPELEKESDETLKAGCMYMFRKFLSDTHQNISDAVDVIKTTWYSNPHFRGTYSYDAANNTETGLHSKLASPLTHENDYPAVMFAGEATHSYYFSTVHGAIETGYREADRLIDYYL